MPHKHLEPVQFRVPATKATGEIASRLSPKQQSREHYLGGLPMGKHKEGCECCFCKTYIGENHPRFGKKHTEASKNKVSESLKGRPAKPFEELKSFTNIRKRIFSERGRKCEICGWSVINPFNNQIPVQIDHKDGNNKNNKKENLIILCPNCHSLTEFFMFYGRKHNPQGLAQE